MPTAYRPRVLLIHDDPLVLRTWQGALVGCDVSVVLNQVDVEAELERHGSEVVVATWSELLEDRVRSCRGSVEFVHVGDPHGSDLLEAVAQGHRVACADGVEQLRGKVFEVARPSRRSLRKPVDSLTIRWEGSTGERVLLDVGNDGFSFATESLDGLEPAGLLQNVSIRRGDAVLVGGVDARVRHIDVRTDDYRIGCQICPSAVVAPGRAAREIRDRAICAGLLQSALKAATLVLETGEDEIVCSDGSVDLASGEVRLPSIRHPFRLFDVVDARFELSSNAYRFRTAISGETPLRLKLPARLEEWHQRTTLRHVFSEGQANAVIELPFTEEPVTRRIRDLSSTGMSFDLAADTDLVPLGLQLPRISIQVGLRRYEVSGCVRNVQRSSEGLRCGVQFTAIAEDTRRDLCATIVRERVPGIEDARNVDFVALWQFFRETGFIAPDKEALLTPVLTQVRATHEALRLPNDVGAGVVIKEGGDLVAHVAGLRAYTDTWMFHHLAAAKGKRAGTVVSLGAIEHLMQNAEYEYFRCWFLANAAFPVAAFAGFARKLPDPELSDLRQFAHFVVPVDRRFGGSLETGDADQRELAKVERALMAAHRSIVVRSEDFTRSALSLGAVDNEYRRIGLTRQRKVVVARKQGRIVGFALVELSSIGLNLSDALSSARLFVLPSDADDAASIRASLLDAVLPIYASTGRSHARFLLDPSEAADYRAMDIMLDRAQSLCWTCHRSQLRPWSEHMEHLFNRLVQRRRRSGIRMANAA